MLQRHGEAQVRAGTEADLPALTDLYNHFIRETSITFDLEPFTPDQRRPWLLSHPKTARTAFWLPKRRQNGRKTRTTVRRTALRRLGGPGPGHPVGALLGYATSSAFRPKAAYAPSVEVTVYCAPRATGRGIGTLLYTALFEALADEDVHRAYAGIAQPNEASHRLHTRFGFRHIGTFTEVGRKFDRYWDVAWYQKDLG